jgi:hypothetical protein
MTSHVLRRAGIDNRHSEIRDCRRRLDSAVTFANRQTIVWLREVTPRFAASGLLNTAELFGCDLAERVP